MVGKTGPFAETATALACFGGASHSSHAAKLRPGVDRWSYLLACPVVDRLSAFRSKLPIPKSDPCVSRGSVCVCRSITGFDIIPEYHTPQTVRRYLFPWLRALPYDGLGHHPASPCPRKTWARACACGCLRLRAWVLACSIMNRIQLRSVPDRTCQPGPPHRTPNRSPLVVFQQ